MNLQEEAAYKRFKPITENPIRLDFSGCKYLGEVHQILKQKFGLPEYYGENWDALWDCLDYLLIDDGPIQVNIYGLTALPKEFSDEMLKMLKVFDDVHAVTPNVAFALIS